jgi:hypothetical protein
MDQPVSTEQGHIQGACLRQACIDFLAEGLTGFGFDMPNRRIVDLLVGLTYWAKSGIFVQTSGLEDICDSTEGGQISFSS